jgi:hypothetical protein
MMGVSGGVAGMTYGACTWPPATNALFAGNGPAMI